MWGVWRASLLAGWKIPASREKEPVCWSPGTGLSWHLESVIKSLPSGQLFTSVYWSEVYLWAKHCAFPISIINITWHIWTYRFRAMALTLILPTKWSWVGRSGQWGVKINCTEKLKHQSAITWHGHGQVTWNIFRTEMYWILRGRKRHLQAIYLVPLFPFIDTQSNAQPILGSLGVITPLAKNMYASLFSAVKYNKNNKMFLHNCLQCTGWIKLLNP